jgi:hypothetical protein
MILIQKSSAKKGSFSPEAEMHVPQSRLRRDAGTSIPLF